MSGIPYPVCIAASGMDAVVAIVIIVAAILQTVLGNRKKARLPPPMPAAPPVSRPGPARAAPRSRPAVPPPAPPQDWSDDEDPLRKILEMIAPPAPVPVPVPPSQPAPRRPVPEPRPAAARRSAAVPELSAMMTPPPPIADIKDMETGLDHPVMRTFPGSSAYLQGLVAWRMSRMPLGPVSGFQASGARPDGVPLWATPEDFRRGMLTHIALMSPPSLPPATDRWLSNP